MKENVNVVELNAAVLLMTGHALSDLSEIHIAGGSLTVVTANQDNSLSVRKLPIVSAQREQAPTPPQPEPQEAEEVETDVESYDEPSDN